MLLKSFELMPMSWGARFVWLALGIAIGGFFGIQEGLRQCWADCEEWAVDLEKITYPPATQCSVPL
jgi:hypothetical protein